MEKGFIPPKTVGLWAGEIRRRKKMKIQTLASRAGISRAYLSEIERGKGNPSEEVIKRLAMVLGVPCSLLMGEESSSKPEKTISPSLKEFIEKERPDPSPLKNLQALEFRGGEPTTIREWRRIYGVIKAITNSEEP